MACRGSIAVVDRRVVLATEGAGTYEVATGSFNRTGPRLRGEGRFSLGGRLPGGLTIGPKLDSVAKAESKRAHLLMVRTRLGRECLRQAWMVAGDALIFGRSLMLSVPQGAGGSGSADTSCNHHVG